MSILFGIIEIVLKPKIYSYYEKKWGKPIKVNIINEVKTVKPITLTENIVKPEIKKYEENVIEIIKPQLPPPPPIPIKSSKKVLNYSSNR